MRPIHMIRLINVRQDLFWRPRERIFRVISRRAGDNGGVVIGHGRTDGSCGKPPGLVADCGRWRVVADVVGRDGWRRVQGMRSLRLKDRVVALTSALTLHAISALWSAFIALSTESSR